jgi:glycosyltransferase involved in cell wall biosynthesis
MKITIFTPVYGRKNATFKTIESIHKNTDYPFEHIIIDNNFPYPDGTDEILEELKTKYKNIKIIKNDINKGLALSHYQTLKESDSDIYIKIDNDIKVKTKNYLEVIVEIYRNLEEIWVLGGTITNIFYKFKILNVFNCYNFTIEELTHVSPPFCITPKKIIQKIGYSNPLLSLRPLEAANFSKKLLKNGFKIGRIKEITGELLYDEYTHEYKKITQENTKFRYSLRLHNYVKSKIR